MIFGIKNSIKCGFFCYIKCSIFAAYNILLYQHRMIEITHPLLLTRQQQNMLDLHSFINILSVITSVCYLIEFDLKKDGALTNSINLVHQLKDDIQEPAKAYEALKNYQLIKQNFLNVLEKEISACTGTTKNKAVAKEINNLKSIFEIVDVRVSEVIKRIENKSKWGVCRNSEVVASIEKFFQAVVQHAKGKYQISFNGSPVKGNAYFIHFKVNSLNGETIFCHAILNDIMRDLFANARKYSPVGTTISATLTQHQQSLTFEIKDQGPGIPADEVHQVVEFGYRASNTINKATMGGGFGLTKAYQFVKENKGRFWIDTAVNQGTTIKIEIPVG